MNWNLLLEIFGFTVGLVYLWYEYHANPKLWIASIIMPMISMWIYYSRGIYADFAINIYYFLIAIYGYIAWTFNFKKREKAELPIRRAPLAAWIGCIAAFVALWSFICWVLVSYTDSTVPVVDAFTTALSIVAMWMLARKYLEQWLAWLVVDAVCIGLYFYKEIYFYAVLYALYTIIAYIGYRKWQGLMAAQTEK